MNEGDGAQQTAQLKETWESVQLLNVLIILSASMLIESQEVKTFLDLHNKKNKKIKIMWKSGFVL